MASTAFLLTCLAGFIGCMGGFIAGFYLGEANYSCPRCKERKELLDRAFNRNDD